MNLLGQAEAIPTLSKTEHPVPTRPTEYSTGERTEYSRYPPPSSDGIICLRLQLKDADIFPCSEEHSDERELLPPFVGIKVRRPRKTGPAAMV
jgi:hypothetical protein